MKTSIFLILYIGVCLTVVDCYRSTRCYQVDDCEEDQCCVAKYGSARKSCAAKPSEGQRCYLNRPLNSDGFPYKCGCQDGLECIEAYEGKFKRARCRQPAGQEDVKEAERRDYLESVAEALKEYLDEEK